MNTYEIIDAFRDAAAAGGMVITGPIVADGLLQRCHIEGDKQGSKNGAYILHADSRPNGWFQHWKSGTTIRWTASGKRQPMTDAMRRQIEDERTKRQIEKEHGYLDAADKAQFIWHSAAPLQHRTHPYLLKKHVDPHGLRIDRHGNLVVPMYNIRKELVSLQFINADGEKRFLSGGKKKGCFAVIGRYSAGNPMIICEGWATGATLHQVTGGLFVVVAMDAGNLEPVAMEFRKLDSDVEIVIAGDNDLPTDKSPNGKGQTDARKAAIAVAGMLLIPTEPGKDWNDIFSAKEVMNG